jgi:PAS domain S-box-containing protein/diguanylate cyclase (GGDEF)-like protein
MRRPPLLTAIDRPLLDGVLAVMQQLGASSSLQQTLDLIVGASVRLLGFGAAAANVTTPDGELRVEAVMGPPGVEELLGSARPMDFWLKLLDGAEHWGGLSFYSHDKDQSLVDQFVTWTPPEPASEEPDAWHPKDAMFAPLWDGDRLVGVLSVDQPVTGRFPDEQQRAILEAFASQAAKAIRDAQSREREQARRQAVENRWQLTFAHSPSAVALVDLDGRIREANDALTSMLGYSRERLLQLSFTDITHPDDIAADVALFDELAHGKRDSYRLTKRYVRADGRIVHGLLHVGVIRGDHGQDTTVVAQVSDITERIAAEQQLAHQLSHDPLTGTPSRAMLSDQLTAKLAEGVPCALLLCDIDRFKTINDSLGRQVGDELLLSAASRLADTVPDGLQLGRVSGDRFMIVAPGQRDPDALRAVAADLIDAIGRPLAAGELHLSVGMSVGIAVSRSWHRHADELIGEAEQALARAKRHGRGRVEVYDPGRDHPFTLRQLHLEQALRTAVSTGAGLDIHLQPIVAVATESTVGFEALIRWRHPDLGLLQPSQFLPIADHSGLIVPLGWRMLELSAQAAARDPSGDRWVSVNVAASQLGRGRLPGAVRDVLAASGIPPSRLRLEITETALVEASAQAIGEVREVVDAGVSIALDDFGTGYSSLSLLRDLPISIVKIDRSFIAPIAVDTRAATLVRSLVAMCNALGIGTVAEGVETREQLALVRALGCELAQGYLFGGASPA